MIIDCHCHLPLSNTTDDMQTFRSVMQDVSKTILLAQPGSDSSQTNNALAEFTKTDDKTVGFAVFNPLKDRPVPKTLKSFTSAIGLKGFVLYCCIDGFHPAHSRALRFYQAAQSLKMPVFFHNSGSLNADSVLDYAQPWLLDEIARLFPNLKIIIGSMGKPFVDQTVAMLKKHDNVFADLTINPSKQWETYNILLSAFEAGVMDKLLFGSGFPDTEPGQCIEALLGFNKITLDTGLPSVPREKIRSIIEKDSLSMLVAN